MGPDDHGFFASDATVQLVYRCTILDLASGQPVVTPSAGAQPGWKNDITACLDWHINSQFQVIVNWRYIQTLGVNNRSDAGASEQPLTDRFLRRRQLPFAVRLGEDCSVICGETAPPEGMFQEGPFPTCPTNLDHSTT